MPNKHNIDRRHHIPKMKFKIQNWPEYEAGLRRRGSLTLWVEDAALAQWQSVGPRGQARYQGIAIETCLMLRAARSGPGNSVSRLSGCFASQFRLKSRTQEQGHDQENETEPLRQFQGFCRSKVEMIILINAN